MRADPDHPGYPFQLHGIALRPDGEIVGFIGLDWVRSSRSIRPMDGIIARWGEQGNEPGQNGLSGEPSIDPVGDIHVFQYVPQELQVFDSKGDCSAANTDIEGQPETSAAVPPRPSSGGTSSGPAPSFDDQGYGWTFGPDGLTKLKVTLPSH